MKTIISIDKINQLTKNDFIGIFGNVFEKTYWIADKAFNLKPYKNLNELLSSIIKIYEDSSKEDCLKIFNAHPELAVEKKLTNDSRKEQNAAKLNRCNNEEFNELISTLIEIYENSSKEDCLKIFNTHPELAIEKKLTEDSRKEQKNANLNRCNNEEFSEFQNLNYDYKKKFGFPFIIAVKGKNKNEILTSFRKRIKNEINLEFEEAKNQVKRIATFRLNEIIN